MTGGGEGIARRSPPTVLALVDMTAQDARVLRATRELADALGAAVVLLHVARPPRRRALWERMAAVDGAAQRVLYRLGARLVRRRLYVQTAVRFGETVEQVEKAAMAVGATLVVASSSPARWLWWRSRDRRLRRSLDIPVILVPARGEGSEDRVRIIGQEVGGPGQRPAA